MPAALQSLRNRTSPPEPAATSSLSLLQQARRRPAAASEDTQAEESAGESLSLEMQVTESADGGLTVTTAGAKPVPETPEETHHVNRRLAREEENILRHRDPDDPGYSDYDQHYEDREHEL